MLQCVAVCCSVLHDSVLHDSVLREGAHLKPSTWYGAVPLVWQSLHKMVTVLFSNSSGMGVWSVSKNNMSGYPIYRHVVCCSMLQRVAVFCSMLQRVAACCSAFYINMSVV